MVQNGQLTVAQKIALQKVSENLVICMSFIIHVVMEERSFEQAFRYE